MSSPSSASRPPAAAPQPAATSALHVADAPSKHISRGSGSGSHVDTLPTAPVHRKGGARALRARAADGSSSARTRRRPDGGGIGPPPQRPRLLRRARRRVVGKGADDAGGILPRVGRTPAGGVATHTAALRAGVGGKERVAAGVAHAGTDAPRMETSAPAASRGSSSGQRTPEPRHAKEEESKPLLLSRPRRPRARVYTARAQRTATDADLRVGRRPRRANARLWFAVRAAI